MEFKQYLVIGASVSVFPGQYVKDLNEDQLRKRRYHVKERKKGVFECIRAFKFKAGEIVWLDSGTVKKRDLKILREPSEIEAPKEDESSVFDDMTKPQLIVWAEKNRKGLELDMKMTRDIMLEEIKTFPDPKKDSKAKAPG